MMYMKLNKAAPAKEIHLHYRGIWLGHPVKPGQFYYFTLWSAEGKLPKPEKFSWKEAEKKQMALNEDIILENYWKWKP